MIFNLKNIAAFCLDQGEKQCSQTYEFFMVLTGQRVDSNGGTHLLKLNPELGTLADFLLVLAGKLL